MPTQWRGVKWFIEDDIRQCCDSLDPPDLVSILSEKLHDQRCIRLISNLCQAGYLEEWPYHSTRSGGPQAGVCSPILMHVSLDRLEQFVARVLLPMYNYGDCRKRYPPYMALLNAARRHTDAGKRAEAQHLRQQAQTRPSRDPDDPHFRRLWYLRYADDTLLGFRGPRAEADTMKAQLKEFLHNSLKWELSPEKPLITHARPHAARLLGDAVVTLDAEAQPD